MELFEFKNPAKVYWQLIFPAGTLVALMAQLVATSCGLGLTFDSHLYLSGAAFFNGAIPGSLLAQPVFQAKPPLFSLILSWLPGESLPFLFTFLLVANLLLLAGLVSEVFTPGYWRNITFLAIALFTPLIMVHVYLWTEPLFLLLFYTTLLVLLKAQKKGLSNVSLVFLAGLSILMIMTRHVGLFFVIGLGLSLTITEKSAWQKALVAFFPAVLVFAIWNFGLMDDGLAGRLNTFLAPVSGGTWSRLQNFQFFFQTAATWFLPNSFGSILRMILLAGLVAFIVVGSKKVDLAPVKSFLAIGITYYLLMHLAFLIDESSADRYLVPVYPLLLIVFFYFLANYFKARTVWLKYLVALWLLYPATRTVKNAFFWQDKLCQENERGPLEWKEDNSAVRQE